MKYKIESVKDIDVWYIIQLISDIYKSRENTKILNTIPFLVSVCNYYFTHALLTEQQQLSVYNIYMTYKAEQDYNKSPKKKK